MRNRLLFVCSGNLDSSPTAEALFQSDSGYEAKSAGILECAPVQVTRKLLEWANQIFAMEQIHRKAILKMMPEAKDKITVLDIPDNYYYGSLKLVRLLTERLRSNDIVIPGAATVGFSKKDGEPEREKGD